MTMLKTYWNWTTTRSDLCDISPAKIFKNLEKEKRNLKLGALILNKKLFSFIYFFIQKHYFYSTPTNQVLNKRIYT